MVYPIDPGPEYGKQRVYGSGQTEIYEPLYARVDETGLSILRLRFTEADRKAIGEGKDLFVSIMTFSTPMQPHGFFVEGVD